MRAHHSICGRAIWADTSSMCWAIGLPPPSSSRVGGGEPGGGAGAGPCLVRGPDGPRGRVRPSWVDPGGRHVSPPGGAGGGWSLPVGGVIVSGGLAGRHPCPPCTPRAVSRQGAPHNSVAHCRHFGSMSLLFPTRPPFRCRGLETKQISQDERQTCYGS